MTPKERILSAMKGAPVDRVPWSPFLAYFWEALPESIQKRGQLDFLESIGADPLLRGFYRLFTVKRKKTHIKEQIKGREKWTTYETPVGNLVSKHVFSPAGNTWFIVDHPVKSREDYKILSYLNEDMDIVPDPHEFNEEFRKLGERGLHLPLIGTEGKSSFQSLLEYWVGTEALVYGLFDFPQTIEECLAIMREKSLISVEISVDSPAEGFIFWEDSSTTNISPDYFQKYTAPEINSWGQVIHKDGKMLIHHACGHLKGLLKVMGAAGIDGIESISPPPTGNVQLWEAAKELPAHIGLVGGIEPTVFLTSTMEELEHYVKYLMDAMSTSRFVLANSDSCPPGVAIEKFKLVSDIVRGKV